MLNPIRSFAKDRRSTAAMEFALLVSVMITLFFGVYEICNAAIVYEEVQNAAHTIPESASNLAVQSDSSTALSYAQIQLAASEIWGEIPEFRTGFQNSTLNSVTVTSVAFIPSLPTAAQVSGTSYTGQTCTPAKSGQQCNYSPTVIWSVAYTGGDSGRTFATSLRSCTATGTQDAMVPYTSNGSTTVQTLPGGLNTKQPPNSGQAGSWTASDLTSLPVANVATTDPNLAPPSPILVVDIHFKYQSILGLFFSGGLDYYATGFFPVRSVKASIINSTTGVTTAQSLSQQFTTIKSAGLPSTSTSYCVNSSTYLSPAATS